jgi:hypothetical protein
MKLTKARLVNAFGFWQGQEIANATHQYFDDIMQAYQHINTIAPGNQIELWTGETGWPSDGTCNWTLRTPLKLIHIFHRWHQLRGRHRRYQERSNLLLPGRLRHDQLGLQRLPFRGL